MASKGMEAGVRELRPCLWEKTSFTKIEPIYFYQDNWAFERILKQRPSDHVDIGSHHKFVSFLSMTLNVTMIDIRPLSLPVNSLSFKEGSILSLPYDSESIDSLSSLCVIEHIGLGRYGDEIDPLGSEKAFTEIDRVLKKGANFYFSVPVELEGRVFFNAHRSFSENYLLETLHNFEVIDKKYIYGEKFETTLRDGFGIGCYHLQKKT